jgi:two-component system, OmpR family, sensor histidine kinase CiaH
MGEIHRIRRKFILAGTLAVIIIVVGALGVINTITYVRMQNSVFSLLTMISENGGQLPSRQIKGPPSWIEDPDWYNDSPESIYQIRYFSILMSRQGDVEAINLAKIASFSRSEAVQAVKAVVESNRDKGIFKKNRASYSFMVTPVNEDHYRIVIMDSTKDVAAVESFARYSVRFGIGCILVYVLILYALCNLIIQPFVHNIENQKRFITNAGHELKTPIAIISANTEVLEMTQGKNEWTANILAQVRRVTRLINDLITMAKLGEAKKEDIQKTEMDLVPWFKETVEQFRPLVKDGEKTLSLEAPETLVAATDKTILTELLNILMDNAIKYCDPQGTIKATLVPEGKKGFSLSVSNHYARGEGEDYTHYFERFYRGDKSHDSTIPGYGIGLSIAREMADLLDGQITVSYKDKVICFSLHFN